MINQNFPQSCELEATSSSRILESLQHPVLVIDADSQVIYANATAAANLGGWIVGSPITDLFLDFARPALITGPSCSRLTSKRNEHYEVLLNPMGDGSICISCWPVPDSTLPVGLAKRDDLTGLLLRNAFMAELQSSLDREVASRGLVARSLQDRQRHPWPSSRRQPAA